MRKMRKKDIESQTAYQQKEKNGLLIWKNHLIFIVYLCFQLKTFDTMQIKDLV